tara:strand:- start:3139 stop:3816 length:678 start_codon:yes stop_codon:yes gene_type:complete
MLSFAMIISISNWYDARLISIFGFIISPGSLIYSLSFLISDSITEVYGYKKLRLAVWTAMFFNLLFIGFGQLVIHMPSPSFPTENVAFDNLLKMNFLVIIASFTGYIVSEPVNSFLVSKLKIKMNGDYIGIRFISSTIIASLIDTVIFVSIAFYSTMAFENLLRMMINIWVIKVLIEIVFLPFSIQLTKHLKKSEEIDIYDYKTNFNIFSLDSTYLDESNQYKKK